MFSFDECEPKRPPREQKLPLASGTVQLETLNGFASEVMSAIHTIWRASVHSFTRDSSTITAKSRFDQTWSLAFSAPSPPRTGKVVWAPLVGGISRRPTSG